jgi:hypothetical protein
MITGAGDTAVRPRRLARVVLLTDRTEEPSLSWQVDGVSCWKFLDAPLLLKPYPAEYDAARFWIYGLPNEARSVRVWELNYCFADIATTVTSPDRLDLTQLDDLAEQEIEPTPLSIVGWN